LVAGLVSAAVVVAALYHYPDLSLAFGYPGVTIAAFIAIVRMPTLLVLVGRACGFRIGLMVLDRSLGRTECRDSVQMVRRFSRSGAFSAADQHTTEEASMTAAETPNIVLVHGGFVDGSGWEGVYRILKRDGHAVSVVQNSTSSLEEDAAATRLILSVHDGASILVGHSYGGAVITEAGNDPKVVGLVYIAAFAPSDGESVNTLIKDPAPGAPVPPILPPVNGYLFLDKAKFHASFAGDLDDDKASFMADSQVPWGVKALGGTITKAAWKTKPSWYLVSTEDRMIPPDAQRFMAKRAGATVVEERGSHSIYVSRPDVVADLIAKAAGGVTVASR
jgi:pimeloyl-ACP methyl ester carboxylesterase